MATGWTVRGSNPGGGRDISGPVQTGPRAHPGSCKAVYLVYFPEVKRPVCDVDHPLLSSASMACSRLKFTFYLRRKATSFFAFHTPLETVCANQIRMMITARPFRVLRTTHSYSLFVNNQLDTQFFFMYFNLYSLRVSDSSVSIIRRINCINKTPGLCHSV